LVHATSLAGVGSDTLSGSLANLQAKMYSTTTGSVDAILAFGRLGVSVGAAEGGFRKATDVFDDVVGKLIGVRNETERTGKAAALNLTPALEVANRALRRAGGDAGLAIKYYQESKAAVAAFGAELSGPALRAIDDYGEATSTLGLYFQGLKNAGTEPLFEAAARLGERLSNLAKTQGGPVRDSVRGAGEAFTRLAPQIERIAELGIQASPAIEKIGVALAGAASGGLSIITVGGEKLIQVFNALGPAGAIAGAAIFAAFFPLTAAFLGIGLVIEDLIGYSKGIPSAFGDALAGWRDFKEEFEFGGDEQPTILKVIYKIGTAIEDAGKKLDALFAKLNSSTVLKFLDNSAAYVDANFLGGQSDRSKKIREDGAVETAASKRLGFLERVAVAIGPDEALSAKYNSIKDEVRAERAGVYQSLPPQSPQNYSTPQVPVPTVPVTPGISYTPAAGGYSSPDGGSSSAPINVTIQVNAGLLGSEQAVTDKIKDTAKQAVGEAIGSAARQRGVGQRQG
jgi:hypothetical protein